MFTTSEKFRPKFKDLKKNCCRIYYDLLNRNNKSAPIKSSDVLVSFLVQYIQSSLWEITGRRSAVIIIMRCHWNDLALIESDWTLLEMVSEFSINLKMLVFRAQLRRRGLKWSQVEAYLFLSGSSAGFASHKSHWNRISHAIVFSLAL